MLELDVRKNNSRTNSSTAKRVSLFSSQKSLSSCPRRLPPLNEASVVASKVTIFHKQTPTKVLEKPLSRSFSRPLNQLLTKEQPPPSAEKSVDTKRIYWNKRTKTSGLVIIVFEGVLGDYYKESLWSKDPPKIKLRDEIVAGIDILSRSYAVVLLLTYSSSKNADILKALRVKNVCIDAAYKRRKGTHRFRQGYGQIAEDFRVESTHNFAIVTAITKEVTPFDDLYEADTSSHKRYPLLYAPFGNYIPNLKVYLVPHFRLNKQLKFMHVSRLILGLNQDRTVFKEVRVPLEIIDQCPVIMPKISDRGNSFYVMLKLISRPPKHPNK